MLNYSEDIISIQKPRETSRVYSVIKSHNDTKLVCEILKHGFVTSGGLFVHTGCKVNFLRKLWLCVCCVGKRVRVLYCRRTSLAEKPALIRYRKGRPIKAENYVALHVVWLTSPATVWRGKTYVKPLERKLTVEITSYRFKCTLTRWSWPDAPVVAVRSATTSRVNSDRCTAFSKHVALPIGANFPNARCSAAVNRLETILAGLRISGLVRILVGTWYRVWNGVNKRSQMEPWSDIRRFDTLPAFPIRDLGVFPFILLVSSAKAASLSCMALTSFVNASSKGSEGRERTVRESEGGQCGGMATR